VETKTKIDENPILIEFLEFVLVRNHYVRPTIHDVIQRFIHVKGAIMNQSTYVIKLFNDLSSLHSESIRAPLYTSGTKGARPKFGHKNAEEPILQEKNPKRKGRNSVSESVVELDSAESAYFKEKCTKITDSIYLGTAYVAQKRDFLRNQLG
jgi:hypothetical protein